MEKYQEVATAAVLFLEAPQHEIAQESNAHQTCKDLGWVIGPENH